MSSTKSNRDSDAPGSPSILNDELRAYYLHLLRSELLPAMGCTEPIAIAYASALCAHELGAKPEHILVACSPNIIKNVKSVIVPNSGGMKGISAAATLGALAGDHKRKLEVIAGATEAEQQSAKAFVEQGGCTVDVLNGDATLRVIVTMTYGSDKVVVELADSHTNIVSIVKNGEEIFTRPRDLSESTRNVPANVGIDSIIEFARTTPLDEVTELLTSQIAMNSAISEEGLRNPWGAQIGRMLRNNAVESMANKAIAAAAAASDARMSGCSLAVVINSGSGNQGVTASLPVIEYAKNLGSSREQLLRALLLSNLAALHQKRFIGKLSAYCGVVCAASAAGAAITYLKGGSDQMIRDTISNSLAVESGMVCDGAKPSCAAKIATAVGSALLAHDMAMSGIRFQAGDGIVKQHVDDTINAVGRLASKGMRETDREILNIMLDK